MEKDPSQVISEEEEDQRRSQKDVSQEHLTHIYEKTQLSVAHQPPPINSVKELEDKVEREEVRQENEKIIQKKIKQSLKYEGKKGTSLTEKPLIKMRRKLRQASQTGPFF